MRFVLILVVLALAPACGDDKAAQQLAAEELASDTLNLDAQDKCNDQGKFYDNTTKKCTKRDLAEWKCTRGGLIDGLGLDEDADMGEFGDRLDDGWKFHQCGESADKLYVIIKKQVTDGDRSTINVESYEFDLE